MLDSIADSEVAGISRIQFSEKVKNLKDKDIEEYAPEIKEAIEDYFSENQNDSIYMCKFLTEYSWWFGSKTINRNDYYVSPTLNLLGLVNVSQSYVADIAYFLASDRQLTEYAHNFREQIQESSNQMDSPAENLIVYGAPGTGKSKYLEDNFSNLTRVVFHSEYSYYDFVGSYKPTPLYKQTENNIFSISGEEFEFGEPSIDYQFRPGPFINVLINAVRRSEVKYTLLIEELNRANAPAVFGDIFQLLDRKTDGSSHYKINPSDELRNYLMSLDDVRHYFQNGLFIPRNMNIVATMNSADQGVFVLDSAFKRRWKFKYMSIKENGFVHENSLINYGGEVFKWRLILSAINGRLKNLGVNEDRLIGPYFISPEEIGDSTSFASKLLIYLWDDVLRMRREKFFDSGIKTYSELISGFAAGIDVINIKNDIYELIAQEESVDTAFEQQEDLAEEHEDEL
ncbi:AAA family ATPase [Bacillus sp. Marseille-Q1617]|uniref:AAA family ATPase n=1 Tax=Bacillus sp. Marseille-Q1617 TaxID=2736887 RepID=UPI00158AD397|nr:AAA family ATPase [Bacillus sp. Marseille-Q1617]